MRIVVAVSCPECNVLAVRVFSGEPTEEEIRGVADECGGMYCVTVNVIDGDRASVRTVESRIREL